MKAHWKKSKSLKPDPLLEKIDSIKTVDDDGLGMHPRAHDTLEQFTLHQFIEAVEIFTETWPWLFGMDEAHRHTLRNLVRQQFEQRHETATGFDVHILDIGGDDPDKLPCLWQATLHHFFIDLAI